MFTNWFYFHVSGEFDAAAYEACPMELDWSDFFHTYCMGCEL